MHRDGLLISVSLKQRSFQFDLGSTLFVSIPLPGFTDSDWDHLRGLELRVDLYVHQIRQIWIHMQRLLSRLLRLSPRSRIQYMP